MRSFLFGRRQSWLTNKERYKTMDEAWEHGPIDNPILYVFEDDELVTVIEPQREALKLLAKHSYYWRECVLSTCRKMLKRNSKDENL